MRKRTTLTCLLALLAYTGRAQDFAQQYLLRADSLYDAEDYPAATICYDSARFFFEKKADWNNATKSVISLGYALDDMGQTEQTIDTYLRYLKTIGIRPGTDSFLVAKIYNTLGFSYKKMERYTAALEAYEKAIAIYEATRANHSNVAYAYRGAAQIYQRRLDFPKTVSYLEKALTKDSTFALQASLHMLLCSVNLDLEKYAVVIQHFDQGIGMAKKPRDIAALKSMGALAYLKLMDFDKAEKLLKESIDGIRANPKIDLELWVDLKNLAELYAVKGEAVQAEKQYNLALADAKKTYPNKNRELAKVCTEFGDFYFHQNKTEAALALYQQALIQVFPNFNSTHISDNPKLTDVYTESWIMTAAARKGEALKRRYDLAGKMADLKNASICFDLSLAAVTALKNSYGSDYAKLYLGDYSHAYFEAAIEVNYLLFEKTMERGYLEKAFSIMEQSKASVLAEGIQKNRALILAGLPAGLLEREQDLRLQLAEMNLAIKTEELKEGQTDHDALTQLRGDLANRLREYEAALADLMNNYPQFRQYMEKPALPTISQIQAYLRTKDAALLEYFMGENHLYIVAVTGAGADIFRVERSPGLDGQFGKFIQYFSDKSAILNDMAGYFAAAHGLYDVLFPEKIKGKLPMRLIIVPDGVLNYVPFDALLTAAYTGNDFSQAPYLMLSHQVSFNFAAGFILRPNPIHNHKGALLNMAPLFANGERGLAPLLGSKNSFAGFRNARELAGRRATLSQFLKYAPGSRLIHLSTHAEAGDGEATARVEFIDAALHLSSLYAMKIPAELVVLSACETGLGQYEKGEGVMSLARGFAYAGASNLAASLWKVAERSTASLFDRFYENMAAGAGKAAAMREAKLWLLKTAASDAQQSPYYWAGFVLIGNDDPMDLPKGQFPAWALGALAATLLVAVFLLKRKRSFNPATAPTKP